MQTVELLKKKKRKKVDPSIYGALQVYHDTARERELTCILWRRQTCNRNCQLYHSQSTVKEPSCGTVLQNLSHWSIHKGSMRRSLLYKTIDHDVEFNSYLWNLKQIPGLAKNCNIYKDQSIYIVFSYEIVIHHGRARSNYNLNIVLGKLSRQTDYVVSGEKSGKFRF